MFFGRSNDTAKQQAEQYGPEWRAEVTISNDPSDDSSSSTRWKPLEDWEKVYEPPQQPQSQSSAHAYMAAKAKQVLVNKVQKSIASKMMTIAQESSSKVLTKAEQEATAAGLKNSEAKNNEV